MWATGPASYNGGMISTDTEPATRQPTVGDVFLARLGARDFERLAELFEPDVVLHALLPDGLRERQGPEQVIDSFAGWFGRVDEYELLDAAAGNVGPRLQLHWRARVRGGGFPDGSFVVEQHIYADPGPSGRIHGMAMLCSGFVREQPDG
jgi:hypothetical protein